MCFPNNRAAMRWHTTKHKTPVSKLLKTQVWCVRHYILHIGTVFILASGETFEQPPRRSPSAPENGGASRRGT